MFDSLILTPALSATQSHLLISADPGTCALPTGGTSTHARPPTRLQRLYYCRENCSQIDETGWNYGRDGERGEQRWEILRSLHSSGTCSTAQVEERTCPQSPHPICHAQTSTKHHLLASSHAQTLTALPESFSVALSCASFPLFFDCMSGPDHITVMVAMISAFSDRCICFCHSQQSSLAPSLLPDLS